MVRCWDVQILWVNTVIRLHGSLGRSGLTTFFCLLIETLHIMKYSSDTAKMCRTFAVCIQLKWLDSCDVLHTHTKKNGFMQFTNNACSFTQIDQGRYCLLTESMDTVIYVDKQYPDQMTSIYMPIWTFAVLSWHKSPFSHVTYHMFQVHVFLGPVH